MAKYKIVIEFECDQPIPEKCLDEVTDACSVQLESLGDGDIATDFDSVLTSATHTRVG